MSFLKAVISFIWAHILLLGGVATQVYVAPPEPAPVSIVATTIKPTETNQPILKTSIIATTTRPKAQASATKPAMRPVETPKQITITPEPPPNFELINTFARQATVNILCTTKTGALSPISGTGVIVKQNGLILTNAHIAEYLLLKDYKEKDFLECNIRTGSPAYPKYKVELVYISPTWVLNNKALLKEQNPQGTGENDFAFLRITDMIDGSKLPDSFPYIQMDVRENLSINEPVVLISYPAGFLGGMSVLQNLNLTSAVINIQDIFTFGDGSVDVISVGGTVVSQKGSSGGLVVDKNATLVGIISTSSDGNTTSQRNLYAITLAYINRALETELGINLSTFVNQDNAQFAKKFQEINAPNLSKLITDELNRN